MKHRKKHKRPNTHNKTKTNKKNPHNFIFCFYTNKKTKKQQTTKTNERKSAQQQHTQHTTNNGGGGGGANKTKHKQHKQ